MNRTLVGVIALVLLAAAAVMWWFMPTGPGASGREETAMWMSACMRVGLVMGALWLALPQLHWAPGWSLKLALLAALAVSVWFGKGGRVVILAAAVYLVVVAVRETTGGGRAGPRRMRPADAGRGGAGPVA